MRRGSRPTIGFFASSATYPWTVRQWEGVAQGALASGVDLIAYFGGVLRSTVFEGQANVVYDLAGPETLDGLAIWSAGINIHTTGREMAAFIDRYGSLPRVSLEVAFPGVPSILMDDYGGMRAAIEHLIEEHGCRRIAFLRGGLGHQGGLERYRAYVEALAERGIPPDPGLVSPPSPNWDGAEAMRVLLEERRVEFDAVAAASDTLALGALQALKAHGMRVPADAAMIGFDDIVECESVSPPLTTVKPPFYEMGIRAIELLVDRISGREAPELEIMPLRLQLRQSCGCSSQALRDAAAEGSPPERPGRAAAPPAVRGRDEEELGRAFVAEVREGRETGFLAALNERLERTEAEEGDVFAWLAAVRDFASPWPGGGPPEGEQRAEALRRRGQILVAEVARRQEARRALLQGARQSAFRAISEALITTFDIEGLMDIIAQELPRLGIPSCLLSLYARPESPTDEARLLLAYDESGRRALPAEGIPFPSSRLAPAGFMADARRGTYVVQALYFQAEQIGFAVFGLRRQEDAALCESLRWQLSGALEGALLRRREQQYTERLEGAYRALQESQERLLVAEKMAALGRVTAVLAHEMNTPLAAARAALLELEKLIEEYRASVDDPSVTPGDHRDISAAMLRARDLAARTTEQAAGFVRSVKAQTGAMRPGERVRFDLAPVIRNCVQELGYALERGKCSVAFKPPEGPVEALGSPGRLNQVLANLINNAIDASAPAGGVIALRLFGGPAGAELQVSDGGCGIAPENLRRIFDPLFTTKPFGRGTGLGLTILHDIVTSDFNGTVEVSSKVGKGSTFTLRFPPVE
jgi:signal transduction histidine kinase/ABC-type sugar transport system substrate-binding protein